MSTHSSCFWGLHEPPCPGAQVLELPVPGKMPSHPHRTEEPLLVKVPGRNSAVFILRGQPGMNKSVRALSLTADHLHVLVARGTCTQEVGGPALQKEGQGEVNEATTLSVPQCHL